MTRAWVRLSPDLSTRSSPTTIITGPVRASAVSFAWAYMVREWLFRVVRASGASAVFAAGPGTWGKAAAPRAIPSINAARSDLGAIIAALRAVLRRLADGGGHLGGTGFQPVRHRQD